MNQLLARELEEVVGTKRAGLRIGLSAEPQLRAAAATLSRTLSDEITATTVVGIMGQDDVPALEALVADIAEEFGLESRIRVHVGSFSVRFSRVLPGPGPAAR
jgi:hypothetical protein